MRDELLKGLTEEQIAKVKECKTSEEVLSLAKNEGIELSNEQLEAVNGGCGGGGSSKSTGKCPQCGSNDVKTVMDYSDQTNFCQCQSCGYGWPIQ